MKGGRQKETVTKGDRQTHRQRQTPKHRDRQTDRERVRVA